MAGKTPVTAEPGKSPEDHFFVVGIGGSAGGMEAISDFLQALPEKTGLAFLYVQHLSPDHQSMLAEILSKKAKIPVQEAENGEKIHPDHLYVIPPDRCMAVRNGRIEITPRHRDRRFPPIDHLFESLAEDVGERGVGVVFSGGDTDGTLGIREIKAAGGLTFAQDEKSAKHPSMPLHAAATGEVDFVLPPEAIARELARIARAPSLVRIAEPGVAEEQQTPERFRGIFRIIRSATGVDFTNYKSSTIGRRISRRMLIAKTESISEYLEFLRRDPQETKALTEDLFINVTSFFRDTGLFAALKETYLPLLLRPVIPEQPLRIWVPGCSTGEEAYSIAICVTELLGENLSSRQVQIFGTDILEKVIDRARSGIYHESALGGISPERLAAFFHKHSDGYQIKRQIRDMCVFARQDLLCDPPFSHIDLISCRNVLIYLTNPTQRRIVSRLHYALNPDGILVLGTSEGIGGLHEQFSIADKALRIFIKRSTPVRLPEGFAMSEQTDGETREKAPVPPPPLSIR